MLLSVMRLTSPVAERTPEITDLLWDVDDDGTRRPVTRSAAVAAFRDQGQRRASRLVAAMPAGGDVLDPQAVLAVEPLAERRWRLAGSRRHEDA